MSRRSLRIDDSLLDRSLPHSTASFSVAAATAGRKNRCRSSRRLSSSCSESLLHHTPRKLAPACNSLNSSGVHSVAASDASLLSLLLDESRIQESAAINSFWGLDSDDDRTESTMLCESTILADRTMIGPDISCVRPHSALIGQEPVCFKHSEALCDCDQLMAPPSCTADSVKPESSPGSEPVIRPGTGLGTEPETQNPEETPTIYCRGRKHKGVMLLWLRICRWFSCLLFVLLRLKLDLHKLELTDVLLLWLNCSLFHLKRAALLCGAALSVTWKRVCGSSSAPHRPTGGRSCFSAMRESNAKDQRVNGALCGAAARAFKWFRRKWSQMNKDENRRFPLGFVLLLVLLFAVLFSALWCGLSSVSLSQLVESELPFLQTLTSPFESTQTQSTKPDSESDSGSSEPALAQSAAVETYEKHQRMENVDTAAEQNSTEYEEFSDSRLERLEQSLSLLWKQTESSGRDLESNACSDSGLDPDSVLEQQLDLIRTRLEQEQQLWEKREAEQQQSHALRLERIEQQLNELGKRTLDLEMKQAAALKDFPDSVPAPYGSEVESRDVLFTELSRLQGALQSVRQEMQALSGCRGTCSQLHNLQQTVAAQVHEQVWTLVFGARVWSGLDSESKPLVQVMSERFVSERSLQGALSALERRVLEQVLTEKKKKEEEEEEKEEEKLPPAGGAVTHQEVHSIVQTALRRFSEDRTGLADFALESGGGSIVSTRCSQTFETKAALLSLFGIPLWYFSQSPRTVIQPDVHPGNCWAFRGSSGEFVIRLSSRVLPSGFSLDHIPRTLSPTGSVQSAPKDFSVYGLRDEVEEEGALLGTYLYDEDGDALQSFTVTEENNESFQFILVKVLSNWGHQEFTCVYRFRVHGKPTVTETETETELRSDPGQDQKQTQEQTQVDRQDQE